MFELERSEDSGYEIRRIIIMNLDESPSPHDTIISVFYLGHSPARGKAVLGICPLKLILEGNGNVLTHCSYWDLSTIKKKMYSIIT